MFKLFEGVETFDELPILIHIHCRYGDIFWEKTVLVEDILATLITTNGAFLKLVLRDYLTNAVQVKPTFTIIALKVSFLVGCIFTRAFLIVAVVSPLKKLLVVLL